MRNLLLIFVASTYLISVTELSQLLKFPLLVEHYVEHKEKDREISLFKFLSMHYANGDVKDKDYEKDQKLPFKSHDGCVVMSFVFVLMDSHTFFSKPVYSNSNSYSVYAEFFAASAHLSSIWQPPKFC